MKTIPEVTALHLCADHDPNGNPRRCFVVFDKRGRHIETIDDAYRGEGALWERWPMFNSAHLGRFAGVDGASPMRDQIYTQTRQRNAVRIDVSVSEYRRFLTRNNNPDDRTVKLRAWADKAEAWNRAN